MEHLAPIAPALLDWFEQNARTLPFRQDPTPYHIWVSEIMLQQTRVAAALEYYHRWMEQLPTIQHLADCPEEKLHKLWEGLGYYNRVRNLQKAAQIVCEQYGGELPGDYNTLLTLPGIGEYTAGAIGSIAFGLPVVAVDGNVLRVFSRLYNDSRDILSPATRRAFSQWVQHHQPPVRSGDYTQALMELSALVCLPGGQPLCHQCPLAHLCRAKAAGTQLELPVKKAAKARKLVDVTVLVVHSPQGCLVQQRGKKGLLAGLWQPLVVEQAMSQEQILAHLEELGFTVKELSSLAPARHIFSHVEWQMQGWQVSVEEAPAPKGCQWASGEELEERYPIPGAFKAYRPAMK